MKRANKVAGGALLVTGTAIGAGMLALPITTGVGSFWGALLLFVLCFLFMLTNLFLFLEANLYSTEVDANIITMAKTRLGVFGQLVAWLSFLLLMYSAAAAYIAGGAALLEHGLQIMLGQQLLPYTGLVIFVGVFLILLFLGVRSLDFVNRCLMLGLIAFYCLLLVLMAPHVHLSHLSGGHFNYLLAAVPILVLSFTSHIIVPSLRAYLENDVKKITQALLIGSVSVLFFYIIWEFLVIGVLPRSGEFSLLAIGKHPSPVTGLTYALNDYLQIRSVTLIVGGFSFFALVTSFLGVALSLVDFFADALVIKKTVGGRLLLLALSFVPPLLFVLCYPAGFLLALSYAGVFVAILYGILPAVMVWKARYTEQLPSRLKVPGGKPVLIFIPCCALLVIGLQIAASLHYLPKP